MIKINNIELEWKGRQSVAWYIEEAMRNPGFADFERAKVMFTTLNDKMLNNEDLATVTVNDGDDIFMLPRLVGG